MSSNSVEIDPQSNILNLHGSITNIINFATRHGFTHENLSEMFRVFTRKFLPESYGAVKRLKGKALFTALLNLNSYHSVVSQILGRLESITRTPESGVEVTLSAVESLITELMSVTLPNLDEKQVASKCDSILKRILPRLISAPAAYQLNTYIRGYRVGFDTELSLDQRCEFINSLECNLDYRLTEKVTLRKNDIPHSLFHSKAILEGNMQHTDDREMDPRATPQPGAVSLTEEVMGLYHTPHHTLGKSVGAGGYMTETPHNTRSSGQPVGPPLHSWGNVTGLADKPRAEQPRGHDLGPVTPSPLGLEGRQDVLHEALVHTPPSSSGAGKFSGGGAPSSGRRDGIKQEDRGGWGPRRSPSPGPGRASQGRERGRSPGPRSKGGVSPSSGNQRLFRRTPNGSLRSLSRENLYVYNDKKGFVPRSPSNRREYSWDRPSQVPSSYCRRCFRFVGGDYKPCSTTHCARYRDCEVSDRKCQTCGGGFHSSSICSKNRFQSPGRSSSAERGTTFNTKLI